MKIVFFGTPRLAQIVLEKLIDSPFRPQVVITGYDAKAGRGLKSQQSPVKQAAIKNKIAVGSQFTPLRQGFAGRAVHSSQFDLGILVAFGKIIPKKILSIPKFGIINVHPSLLPEYRGPSPIQSAILAPETKTGVSIMLLDEIVDHGPILMQKEVEIDGSDTHQSLVEKMGQIGADLLIETLPNYIAGKIKPKAQDHASATFTKHITKLDGYIDLSHPPTHQIFDRMVRAYYPWPGVYTKLMVNSKWLMVKFLPISLHPQHARSIYPFLVQPEGKNKMTIADFLRGHPDLKKLFEQLI